MHFRADATAPLETETHVARSSSGPPWTTDYPACIPLVVYSRLFDGGLVITSAELQLMGVDEDLNQLDDYVRRLKVEYDVYFGGGAKKPPAELEWKLKNLLKKHADGQNLSFGQRFRFNTIQQKYALFAALWQQKLRIKEEGYRRPQDAVLGIQGLRAEEQHAAEAALHHHDLPDTSGSDQPFSIDCADVDTEPQKVETLFSVLSKARQQAGDTSSGNLASFRNFVRKKTAEIRKEYGCPAVEYSVELKGGRVKLKAKPKT